MRFPRALLAGAIVASAALAACGGEEAPSQPTPSVTVTVTVSPVYKVVEAGTTFQLNATVVGSSNRNVVWSIVSPQSGGGSISATGLYTPPPEITGDSLAVTVRATHAGDTASGSATISVRPGPLVALRRPGVDSRYVYDSYRTDTNNVKEPGSEKEYGDTVVAVGGSLGGLDSVVTVSSGRDGTWFIRYEANLDIMVRRAYESGDRWLRLPFGGGAGEKLTLRDSLAPDGVRRSYTVETTYLGAETGTIGGRKYAIRKVRIREIEKKTGSDGYTWTFDDTYYFAPALGWFVRVDHLGTYDDAVDHWPLGRYSTLSSADVK